MTGPQKAARAAASKTEIRPPQGIRDKLFKSFFFATMTFLRRRASYNYMLSTGPIRFILYSSFAAAALLSAQTAPNPQPRPAATAQSISTLPATPPTVEPVVPLTPSQQQPKHAQVTLANGILSVSADNSSLNQILRQISHETGIKIIGGVMDERVFGQYGPAAPDQILTELLDGTGSNMIFVNHDGDPAELILTPRQGGPTPPNPNAAAFDDKADSQDSQPQPAPEATPPTAETPRPPSSTFPPLTPATPATSTPADASQPDSPNGVKTPQQIYEQLQRLRQQTPPQ